MKPQLWFVLFYAGGVSFALGEADVKSLLNAPLTHVPAKPEPAQPAEAPQRQPDSPAVPQIRPEAAAQSGLPRDALPGSPQLRMPPESERGADHLLERNPATPTAGTESIQAASVNRLFENALHAHPAEFSEMDARDGIYVLDPPSADTGLLGDGEPGTRIPGGHPVTQQGHSYRARGFAPPEGMPESPVPDHSGQGPTRMVGPPSANLRDAGSGAASSIKIESMDVRPSSRILIEDMQIEVAPPAEADAGQSEAPARSQVIIEDIQIEVAPPTEKEPPEIPKEDLIKLQDGDAPAAGGSLNPFTGIDHAPPPRHPDQVNPGPAGATPLPEGVRVRPTDLDVNPDPNLYQREFNPAETMQRFESPDQVRP